MLTLKPITTKCLTAIAVVGMMFFVAGCSPESTKTYSKTEKGNHDDHNHDEHALGPHGGHVIEIGDDDYHAEMTFDEKTRDIKIYIYDGDHDLKNFSPIEAKDIKINLTGDKKQQLTLVATPQKDDPKGKSSLFSIAGKTVPESIHDEEDIVGKLSVKAGEKTYSPEISHDHDHGHDDHHGHDHDKGHKDEKK